MATYTDNYQLTKPLYSETADVAAINNNMDKIDDIMHASQVSLAPAYDQNETYNTGDVVMYEFLMYECLEDNVTGVWDATKWQRTTAGEHGGGSDVEITPTLATGTKIADYEIDGVAGAIYTPTAPTALSQLSDDSTHRLVTDTEKDTWNGKQNALTFDDVPIDGSNNPVKSNGIYDALATKANTSDVEDFIDKNFTEHQNKNLINEDDVEKNCRYESNVKIDTNNWDSSGKISLSEGDTIKFTLKQNGTRDFYPMFYFNIYTSDGSTLVDYDNSGIREYTATTDCMVRFTWNTSGGTRTDPFLGITPFDISYYDVYRKYYSCNNAERLAGYNKVWACVGDSMTEVNSTAKSKYYNYIANDLGLTVLNYGISGTGYAAQKSENKAFYQRISNITDNFDFLTIFGSVNDIILISTMGLGTYTDSGTSTIAGCINTALDNFFTVAPFKQIGIISQPPSVGTTPDGALLGTNAQAYNDLLNQICANRGIPFLDLFNCSGLRPWDSDYRTEFYNEDGTQDTGVHPNSKGHKIIADRIYDFVKSLFLP